MSLIALNNSQCKQNESVPQAPNDPARRNTALVDWAALPARAFGDLRFGPRHYSVLGVICKAADTNTGLAVISQGRIGKKGKRSRQTVAATIDELIEWRYLVRIYRGRKTSSLSKGQFKTFAYSIVYELSEEAQSCFKEASKRRRNKNRRVNHVGYTGHVNHVGDNAVSPAWVDEF